MYIKPAIIYLSFFLFCFRGQVVYQYLNSNFHGIMEKKLKKKKQRTIRVCLSYHAIPLNKGVARKQAILHIKSTP